MELKRVLRRIALILMICLACFLPVPIIFQKKDDLPKFPIEMVEQDDEETDDEEKALF